MKKRVAIFLAAIIAISVLFSFGGCTKTKPAAEQFQDAASSVGKYFSEFMKAGLSLPDFKSAKGIEENFTMKVDQLKSADQNLLTDEISATVHEITDDTALSSACDGVLNAGGEKVPFVVYQKGGTDILIGVPEASKKYLSLLKQADGASSTTAATDTVKKIVAAVVSRIDAKSVKSESVEYTVDGTKQSSVTKLTFAPDEATRKAIYDDINAAMKSAGADVTDMEKDSISELSVSFYVYRGSTVGMDFTLADAGDDPGKLSGSLTLKNKDGKEFAADGTVSFDSKDVKCTLTLNAQQTVTDSGRTGNINLSVDTGKDNPTISGKIDYTDVKSGSDITNTTKATLTVKTGGTSISVEIPVNVKYTVSDTSLKGTYDASADFQGFKMALSGAFDMAQTDAGKVTIPEIPADQQIAIAGVDGSGSQALSEWTAEIAAKFPKLFGAMDNSGLTAGGENAEFYLMNDTTGEMLQFNSDKTGSVTSNVTFEQTDGKAVVTLDENGTQVGFGYKPFGSDGYQMNQKVQLEDKEFDAVVSETSIMLTNEELGWTFWFSPEDHSGTFDRSFTYEKTDSAITVQVLSESAPQELKKSGDQYMLGNVAYNYEEASSFTDE